MTKPILDFNARDLVHMTEDQIYDIPKGHDLSIAFEDKIEVYSREATIFSWYLWHIHRVFPGIPVYSNHHLGHATVTPKSHMVLLSNIRKTVVDFSGIENEKEIERLNEAAYDAFNLMYNGLTVRLEAYITSISIIDFMEVEYNPQIKELNDSLINADRVSSKDIGNVHKAILKVLREDPSLDNNAIARAIRHKLIREGSIIQCVSARGFVKEVDSFQFPVPITTGFFRGMNTFTAFATESRTATTSEFMTKDPMRKSEYLNRQLQLLTSSIKRLHFGDCGSRETMYFVGPPPESMKDLEGIHYFDDDGNEKVIKPTDYHLSGKPLKIRSLWTCKHPDRYGVCSACYGELSNNIVPTDHIGHIAAIEQQSGQSQLILSFKHFTNSVELMEFTLQPEAKEFFTHKAKTGSQDIYMQPIHKDSTIVIYQEEGQNLDDLRHLDNLDKVTPNRFTSISAMGFITGPKDKEKRKIIRTEINNRVPYLTEDALRYIAENGYTINEKGAYLIKLDKWDFEKPLLSLPKKQFSAEEYSDMIKRFIKGTHPSKRKPTDTKVVTDFTTPDAALQAFHDIVAERLDVNLIHLQIILYGAMAYKPDEGVYNLPLPENRRDGKFVKTSAKMKRGNVAVAMAYEKQIDTLFDPESYMQDGDRPTSEYDYILNGDNDEDAKT